MSKKIAKRLNDDRGNLGEAFIMWHFLPAIETHTDETGKITKRVVYKNFYLGIGRFGIELTLSF